MDGYVIVIGASAGGLQALNQLTAGLHRDLAASLFVVMHIPPWHRSELPQILSGIGSLPAIHPNNGQPIEPGHIYVAPPDYHLLMQDSRAQLWRGPKENRHRPAINVLFRSAAETYGERVIGVILSGTLDDGAAGLWWIKRHGGIAVVQDPADAQFSEMPREALKHVQADHIVPARDMGPLLTALTRERTTQRRMRQPTPRSGVERLDRGRP